MSQTLSETTRTRTSRPRRWRTFAAALATAAGLIGAAGAETVADPRLDVVYVPTPQAVVDRMLEIAEVRPADFVVDLGCGDGRMVVTAAQKFGARGLGVDIDERRIAEANANARAAGVSDKVEFRVGNLYDVELSQVDVLALYLLNEINLKLRPTIQSTMKPGSRVVSHAFHMGDWVADHEERVAGRIVYSWVVPAQAAGRWQLRQGERRIDLALDQKHQFLSGSASENGRSVALREGRVNGSEISYVLETRAGERQSYRGRIAGDEIVSLAGESAPWRATRLSRRAP